MKHKKCIKLIHLLLTLLFSFYPMSAFATEAINTENAVETDVNSNQSSSGNDNNSETVTSHNDNSQESITSENTIESETNITQPTISSESVQEAITNESNIDAFLDNEPLDTWMPDKILQEKLALILGVSVSDLTKEFLADKIVSLGIDDGQYGYAPIKDLSGIEFLKGYEIFYTPGKDITTESLTAFFGDHLENLLHLDWYGDAINYSQIDLYTVFKDCPAFLNNQRDYPFLDITGRIAVPSKKPLNIYPESYKPNGKLSIPLKDIGFWSPTDLKLFSEEDVTSCSDLIIKDNNKTVATYKYSGFDNETQSILFSFDASNSDSFENLAGKKLTYELISLVNGQAFSTIPNFYFGTFNDTNISDVSINQSHEFFMFSEINFIFENAVTIQYQDTEGNIIAPNIVKIGNVGDAYTSEQLVVDGYTFKEVIGNPTGTLTDTPQSVIYVYAKINSPVEPTEPTGPKTKLVAKTVPIRSTSKSTALPKTGETNSPVLTLIGSMTILAGGIYVLNLNRKKSN